MIILPICSAIMNGIMGWAMWEISYMQDDFLLRIMAVLSIFMGLFTLAMEVM